MTQRGIFMSLVGIVNSDPAIESRIRSEFQKLRSETMSLHFATTPARIKEVMNFDLPEIVILNLTDPQIDFNAVFEDIRQDIWLHNFGIVCLYDKKVMDEDQAAEALKNFNALAFITHQYIEANLIKYIRIIEANQQIIFQYDLADKLSGLITGSFVLDNDLTSIPVFTALALAALFQHGFINSENKINLQLVLQELLINAIEHGNCAISFEEKSEYLSHGGNISDLVADKCTDPVIAAKKVTLEWEIRPDETKFIIRDDGKGFDVIAYRDRYKLNPEMLHGRGILLAKALVKKLAYNKKGSAVTITVAHDFTVLRDSPQGFSGEEVLVPSPGEIIFREGEDSDFLYYISSGTYAASLGGTVVGTIVPGDIFMGEMAFLLNNKRSVTVTATTKGKLIKVSRKSFLNVVREYPHYGIFLSKLLARKLARANRETARLRDF